MGDLGYLYSVNNKTFDANQPKSFLLVNSFNSIGIKKRSHVLNGKILCGLSWKSANKDIGSSKSLNLIELAPLLLIENIEFVSLQYGSTKDEIEYIQKIIGKKIHTIDELDVYNDIDGLLSLISDCDFVVTTSNITAHLTGSIGKKGMVLLPFSKGKIWYWHSGEGQSTWYPSLQLASQTQMNDWTYPIQKCKDWILGQI
jgi:ADP-heptose:LPS heptosyltransferase